MLFKNRFIMAPIKLGYTAGDGQVTEKHLQFYGARAGSLGAITLEPLYMDAGLREIPTQLGIDADDKLAGLTRLVESIHAQGTAVIAHLNHPGRMANPKIPGNYFLSATARACENGGAEPRTMDDAQRETVIQQFVQAARRAATAGFDALELQLGHGYLLAQYLSPAVNDRQDEYGGALANRMRFPLAVYDAVQAAVDLPLLVRISAEEMLPGGIPFAETVVLAKALEQRGAAAIHVSLGTVCSTPPWFFQHMFVPKGKTWEFTRKLKTEVKLPMVFVGRIDSPEDLEATGAGDEDLIAIGRGLVADPQLVEKLLGENSGRIRPCLACAEGCLGGVRSGKGLGCSVNPEAGNESTAGITPAESSRHFAVIGGGLAGMEAALTLRKRGHAVDLYEKNELGGQFNLAWLPPHKDSLQAIIDYYKKEIAAREIPVIWETATLEELQAGNYDDVILATGSTPVIPPIPGLQDYYGAEFLESMHLPENQQIAVIGGGLIGIEIASKLVEKNNKVTIIEMLSEVARDMEMIEKKLTLKKLMDAGVVMLTDTRVTGVDGDRLTLSGPGPAELTGIDRIIVAAGVRKNQDLLEQLQAHWPTHPVGDAREVGNAQTAIHSAREICRQL